MSAKKTSQAVGGSYWTESGIRVDGRLVRHFEVRPTEKELERARKQPDGRYLMEFGPRLKDGERVTLIAALAQRFILRLEGIGMVSCRIEGNGAIRVSDSLHLQDSPVFMTA